LHGLMTSITTSGSMMPRIACVVPIFNFAGDPLIERNHEQCIRQLSSPSVDVYTERATLCNGRMAYLWQKEALINRAALRLKDQYEVLAWVDSGIRLSNGWECRLLESIDRGYDVIHLFSQGVWLDQYGRVEGRRLGYVYHRQSNLDPIPRNRPKPSVGAAWAARSQVFDQITLYDRQVVGGGDTWALNGLMGVNTPEAQVTRHMSTEHRKHVQQWILKARALRLKVGWIEGSYTHLWHITPGGRQHGERHHILYDGNYSPARDTQLAPDGLVEWTGTAQPEMVERVKRFLEGRNRR